MRKVVHLVLGIVAFSGCLCASEGIEHFENKVRPLLIEHCYQCHSAEQKIKGGLSLDHRAGWEIGGDSGPALKPGSPEESLILRVVSYEDRDLKMPPKKKLADQDIEILRQWISNGAPDPRDEVPGDLASSSVKPKVISAEELWSFQPVESPTPESRHPKVSDNDWARDPVDQHILAALEKANLAPVQDATPAALVRRLFFDLTGLPPSPEEVADFKRENLEAYVDRLLATEAFAERWTQHWLDITRFAESSGGGRTLPFKDAWRFRDYVIQSIHHDTPINQMIIEQIAGDLLPHQSHNERNRQLTATAFLALGPTNYEEQEKGLLRMDIIDEQLETIGRSFMGLTIGCARCHDHKFDPVTTRDYYALAGIFRSTQTLRDYQSNVSHWNTQNLPVEPELEKELQKKEQRLDAMKAELEKVVATLKRTQPKADQLPPGKPLDPTSLPGLVMDDTAAKKVGRWTSSTFYPNYIGEGYIHDSKASKGSCSATFIPDLPKSGLYEVRVAYTAASDRSKKVLIHILHADGEEDIFIDQTVTPPVDSRFVSLGTFRFVKDGAGFVLVSNQDTEGVVTLDAIWMLNEQELEAERTRGAQPDPQQSDLLAKRKTLESEIKMLQSTSPFRPETMSVKEDSKPADCAIHIRGSIRNLGPSVPRGFIQAAFIPDAPIIPENQSGRLQLAQWMTHPKHPLTARVMVNRVWMHLFGEGLVRSVDNFGASGELPSHPVLLDHLANDFMADGWGLKKLVRRLVLTRTYQLASVPPSGADWKQAEKADPDNRLLWRAHRKRLDANALRDAILIVSQRLDSTFLGPNVQTGEVDPNSSEAQNLEYSYVFSDNRRSLYSPAFRNKRLEFFETFDFADINGPIGQRTRGTIVPQALFFLNHAFLFEQSQAAADRLLKMTALASVEDRIQWLWHSILGRAPSPSEKERVVDFINPLPSETSSETASSQWAQLIQTLFASADFRFLD